MTNTFLRRILKGKRPKGATYSLIAFNILLAIYLIIIIDKWYGLWSKDQNVEIVINYFERKTIQITDNKYTNNPLLVLATTFATNNLNRYQNLVLKTTIENWSKLRPIVQPVLFTNDTDTPLIRFAVHNNWDVMPISSATKEDLPHFKSLMQSAREVYPQSKFYGYANSDIQFDQSLIKTLTGVLRFESAFNGGMLVVGRRRNFNVSLQLSESAYDIENIHQLSRNSTVHKARAADYLLFSRHLNVFNWSNIVDVSVGRPSYDMYIISMAKRMGVTVIDATKTLLALHLSTPNDRHSQIDTNYNRRLIGKFDYYSGSYLSINLVTAYGINGGVIVIHRP